MGINVKSEKWKLLHHSHSKKAQNDTDHSGFLLVRLFLSALSLSAFTFGGGYVIVTLMKKKFVDELHWVEEEEMLDLVAIAQSSPGAIAVNGAIVVGYKLAGLLGVITTVIATVLPPFVILTLISFCYTAFRSNPIVGWMLEGMQAGVGAVIAQVVWEMAAPLAWERKWLSLLVMAAAFGANWFFHVSAVFIILACGLLGAVWTLCQKPDKQKLSGQKPDRKGGGQ